MYRFILIAIFIFVPSLAYGQVSIVNALPDIMSEYGWNSTVAASGAYRKDDNYDEFLVLSTAGSSLYKERFWSIYGLVKNTYRLENKETKELSTVEHIRARINMAGFSRPDQSCFIPDEALEDCIRHSLWDRLILESFVQHEFDKFRKLNARVLAGAGPAMQVLYAEQYNLMVGTAYMLEYLNFTFPSEELNHRWSNYFQFQLKISDNLKFDAVTFAQFKLDDFSDFLWMGSIASTTKATKWLNIQFNIDINYDSRPPPGAKNFSVQTSSALIIKF